MLLPQRYKIRQYVDFFTTPTRFERNFKIEKGADSPDINS